MNNPQEKTEGQEKYDLDIYAQAKKYNRLLFSFVRPYLQTNFVQSVLDFGSGVGTFSDMVRDNFPEKKLRLLEIEAGFVANLQSRNFDVITDLRQLDDASQDLIYSFNVLEHIEDDLAVVRILQQKLRPGGTLFTFAPACEKAFSGLDTHFLHFRRYSKSRMKWLAQESGLELIRWHFFDSLGLLYLLLSLKIRGKVSTPNQKQVLFYDSFGLPVSRLMDLFFSKIFGKNLIFIMRKKK